MRTRIALLAAAVALAAGPAVAAQKAAGLKKGTPDVKSITALAFGPNGTLFIGDSQAGTVTAVATSDTQPASKADVNIPNLGDKLGSALGTTAANVAVADVKVNPASGNIYLAVTRGKGKDAAPVVVKLTRDGNLAPFELKDVEYATVRLPNATTNEKQRTDAITSLAFVDGKLIVAGLSNEEFASTLRVIPYPFTQADKGTGVQIFHGAHGRLETQAPVRTFVPYKIGGADYILAAYTCTPLVKLPVADLKPGEKVKGTTIAELGNMNRPLDMVVYAKDGKDYLLMANTRHGVIKVPTDGAGNAEPITAPVRGGAKAGIKYETISELKGVVQLDKLDADRALILVQNEDKSLALKSIPLP